MGVSIYKFSEKQIACSHHYRDNQADAWLKVRFIALLMLAKGSEIDKIASVIGKSYLFSGHEIDS